MVHSPSARGYYRPELDGLRAIAVLAVIASHAGEPFSHFLPGGFLGVDIFFVLSGFLITGILAREISEERFSLRSFYERRARRILPALIVVSAASLPVAWVVMSPDQLKGFAQSLVGIGLFASNIYFWLTSGYFAPVAESLPMIHTWSLAVEEQYYVFFPLLFLLLWRRGWVMVGLAVTLAVSLIVSELMARSVPSAAFYLLPSRAWELLAGSIAGYMATRHGLPDGTTGPKVWRLLGQYRNSLSWLGILAVMGSLVIYHAGMTLPGFLLIMPIGATVLLLLCVQPGGGVQKILSSPPMVGVGLISYSAYLWHQPVFAFARLSQLHPPSPLIMVILSAVVLGLAWASWALIETPFRDTKRPFRPIAWGLGGAMAAMLAFGLVGHIQAGFGPLRFSADKMAGFDTAKPSPYRALCHNQPTESACVYLGDTPPRWIVFGDSHGVELAYALAKFAQAEGATVEHHTRSGCPPALQFASLRPACDVWTRNTLTALEERPEPATVVLTYRHPLYLSGSNEEHYPQLPDDLSRIVSDGTPAQKRALYWASFREMVRRLHIAGHRVILMQPVPEIARTMEAYLMHGPQTEAERGAGRIPSVPRSYYEARSSTIRTTIIGIADDSHQISVIDPAAAFCNEVTCYAMIGGQSLYFDGNHPSVVGAQRIVDIAFSQPEP